MRKPTGLDKTLFDAATASTMKVLEIYLKSGDLESVRELVRQHGEHQWSQGFLAGKSAEIVKAS